MEDAGLIFVHGSLHDASCWTAVLSRLTIPAIAVDLPGRGANPADVATVTLSDCVATVLAAAECAGFGLFGLVGHSLGGVTITETAVRHPDRVNRLIYVGAVIPAPGEGATMAAIGRNSPEGLPVAPNPQTATAMFRPGLTDEQWARHRDTLVPESPILSNARLSGYPSGIPTTYISMPDDAGVPPDLARQMIANLGGVIDHRTLPGGHLVMISKPAELATLIESVIR